MKFLCESFDVNNKALISFKQIKDYKVTAIKKYTFWPIAIKEKLLK